MQQGFTDVGAASISMNHIYQATRMTRNVMRNIGAVATPALVIHAIDDDTSSVKSANFITRNIGSRTVRKIFLDNCYHIVTMDNEKETVARETGSFFIETIGKESAGVRSAGLVPFSGLRAAKA